MGPFVGPLVGPLVGSRFAFACSVRRPKKQDEWGPIALDDVLMSDTVYSGKHRTSVSRRGKHRQKKIHDATCHTERRTSSDLARRKFTNYHYIGIVQKVFSEKASATARMRQKCVRNASKMRQKCVKIGLVLLGKEERPKCVRNASKLRPKCVKNARNTFGGEHLLDDTD